MGQGIKLLFKYTTMTKFINDSLTNKAVLN